MKLRQRTVGAQLRSQPVSSAGGPANSGPPATPSGGIAPVSIFGAAEALADPEARGWILTWSWTL